MSARDEDRLVDGRTIEDVLAEDDRQRRRDQAERDEAQFDAYMSRYFGVEPPERPERSTPKPDVDGDPDLRAGARRDADDGFGDGLRIDAYIADHFAATRP